jgi:hypothetical protein
MDNEQKLNINWRRMLFENIFTLIYVFINIGLCLIYTRQIQTFTNELYRIIALIGILFFITKTIYPTLSHIVIVENKIRED